MTMRWYILCGIAVLLALGVVAGTRGGGTIAEARLAFEQARLPVAAPAKKPAPPAPLSNAPEPKALNLDVPFTIQAPFQNWDAIHEQTCEEAAVAMADAYFTRRTFTPERADDELLKLVAWQKERFGYFEDTTAEETAVILREYYHRRAEVRSDVSADAIKRELAAGRLVILPLNGRYLNPFFRNGGPSYHMLVVKGYTATRFITNDPGTRHGQNYPYAFDFLLNATHDWNGGDVPRGPRRMIVVYP